MTTIEWCDEVWNPVTGCSKVSPGCAHCYAEAVALRFNPPDKRLPWTPANAAENVVLHPDRLDKPLHWRKPRRVFVNSMSDLFHELVPVEFIDRVFAVMALCGGERIRFCDRADCDHESIEGCASRRRFEARHTFQILTKRPERMLAYMMADDLQDRILDAVQHTGFFWEYPELIIESAGWPLKNVWLGVSVENQRWADERIPLLLQTPAAVRFLSCEPLLGPVDLTNISTQGEQWNVLDRCEAADAALEGSVSTTIDWVIVGGESGPKARPMDLAWARSLRDQCAVPRVPMFMKQVGGRYPGGALPDDLNVREFPEAK